ncbi:hypothetical protein ON010_g1060 [Phytophthora cinnamomi]|nr:hypothetical protein ON010_g1060 [Phytophthora cinnamomi]
MVSEAATYHRSLPVLGPVTCHHLVLVLRTLVSLPSDPQPRSRQAPDADRRTTNEPRVLESCGLAKPVLTRSVRTTE